MYRKILSFIVLFSFVSYLAGCTSMRYVSREEMPEIEQEPSVWVTMVDGTQYEVNTPKIVDSKLAGHVEGEGYKEIDISEIESLGIKKLDKGKTIVLGMIGVTGAIILIWNLSNDKDSEPCST